MTPVSIGISCGVDTVHAEVVLDTLETLFSGLSNVAILRSELGLLLQATGHDARMAYDGVSAVKVAREFRPHVVLLDIGLPGLDGYEVAQRLRQDASFVDVVLVAMTGYGQETDKLRSHDTGFNHHLVKPADFGKVQQVLATVSVNCGDCDAGGFTPVPFDLPDNH